MSIVQLKAATATAEHGCRPGLPDHFDMNEAGPLSFPCVVCVHADADLAVAPCLGCRHYAI